MAIAVIGGLLTSTVLSLVFVPVAFTFVDDAQGWLAQAPRPLGPAGSRRRSERRRAARPATPEPRRTPPLPPPASAYPRLARRTASSSGADRLPPLRDPRDPSCIVCAIGNPSEKVLFIEKHSPGCDISQGQDWRLCIPGFNSQLGKHAAKLSPVREQRPSTIHSHACWSKLKPHPVRGSKYEGKFAVTARADTEIAKNASKGLSVSHNFDSMHRPVRRSKRRWARGRRQSWSHTVSSYSPTYSPTG